MPWTDAAGRFSAFKLLVFLAVLTPAAWLAYQALCGLLQPDAVADAIHQSGDWSVRLLLVGLAITPLRSVTHWPRVVLARRMVGVAAMGYAVLHLGLYVVQQDYRLGHVASEIILRIYLTIGFVALLGLVALGATSTDGMIRRLGGRRWKRLHLTVYALIPLALLHYFLQSKIDVTLPVILTGLFIGLMVLRGVVRLTGDLTPLSLMLVAIGTSVVTALLEAGWYVAATGVMAERILRANLMWDLQPRPALWVAAAGLALVLLALARPLWSRRRKPVTGSARSNRSSAALRAPDAPAQPQTAQTSG
jgi:methionine sulfoxide reductase heme-binding subunit